MKALAIFLFHSFLFISPFNTIKMDNHQLFLKKQQQYQEDTALYEETLAQYQELYALYQELPAEDPDRPSLKAALLKTKEGLKAFKPQLKTDKANLKQLFLALKEEDIPKTDFLLQFAQNALDLADKAKSLKSNIQKDKWLRTNALNHLYICFSQGKKLKVCRLIAADIKALVEQADNKPPSMFLEELAQIFERYDAVEKIKKYRAKSRFIESSIAPYVLSPNQLEPILDQALAKDDFLTEEELKEKEKELEETRKEKEREKEMAIEKWTAKVENWKTQSIKTIYELMVLDTLEKYRDLKINAIYVLEEIKEWDKVDDPKVVQLIFDYSRKLLPKGQLSNEDVSSNMIKVIDKTATFLIAHPEAWYENHTKVVLPNLHKILALLAEIDGARAKFNCYDIYLDWVRQSNVFATDNSVYKLDCLTEKLIAYFKKEAAMAAFAPALEAELKQLKASLKGRNIILAHHLIRPYKKAIGNTFFHKEKNGLISYIEANRANATLAEDLALILAHNFQEDNIKEAIKSCQQAVVQWAPSHTEDSLTQNILLSNDSTLSLTIKFQLNKNNGQYAAKATALSMNVSQKKGPDYEIKASFNARLIVEADGTAYHEFSAEISYKIAADQRTVNIAAEAGVEIGSSKTKGSTHNIGRTGAANFGLDGILGGDYSLTDEYATEKSTTNYSSANVSINASVANTKTEGMQEGFFKLVKGSLQTVKKGNSVEVQWLLLDPIDNFVYPNGGISVKQVLSNNADQLIKEIPLHKK
ncbi:hypothetical protein [Saprospira grandis]|uniref:Uncharacterized protein n=1 Tax=Saprospira grandis (strain Lewin) TaxID=984262 RepID=H6L9D0_SAPGL|nr:hypothetical protein [Saprospira grandis]AFC25406.1 hypothetical protein SGRA_2678 [Saprospira grandis str. Lewin]